MGLQAHTAPPAFSRPRGGSRAGDSWPRRPRPPFRTSGGQRGGAWPCRVRHRGVPRGGTRERETGSEIGPD